MNHLHDFATTANQKTREEFATAYPYNFLITKLQDDESGEWSFQTLTVVNPMFAGKPALLLNEDAHRYRVFPLVKAVNAPWPERISVGRARNNDVVLRDNSISKLHALFMLNDGPHVSVVDAGSRNGTRVNGKTIPQGEKAQVRINDRVLLGTVSLLLLDSAGLYDLIYSLRA